MKTTGILVLLLAAAVLAGCSDDSSTEPTPPPGGGGGTVTEAEPNDTAPQAAGTLRDSAIVITGSCASAADVDRFSFVLATQRTFNASLSWTGGADLDLGVTNSNGIMLAYRDTGGSPESCTLTSMAAGTYVLRVGSFTNQAQSYRLTITPR